MPPKNTASNIQTAPKVPQIKAPTMRPFNQAGLSGEYAREVTVVAIPRPPMRLSAALGKSIEALPVAKISLNEEYSIK
jgi:hypothetical protein